ncbi:uncharacterized protein LOC120332050 [Styela clava]
MIDLIKKDKMIDYIYQLLSKAYEPEETNTLYNTDVVDDNSSMLVNILVPMSVVLLLVALAILIVVIKRRKEQQRGNPAESDQSKAQASNQSGEGIYSAAEDINQSSPQQMGAVGLSNQLEQGQSNHLFILNQSDVAYSTVEKIRGTNQTVEYHKTMVNNVLYGETGGESVDSKKNSPNASDEAKTVVNVLYGETGGGSDDAQKYPPNAPPSVEAETVVYVLYGATA